ncbi:DUF2079 domain-containing protein [Youngiibacter multivorans]|uniref:Membrane protein n=1 Tax=Youngiibacter multivorans TaxID=937251 RepID=A0ABS4G0G2_9CLOT|nr:DUF2079 domain-containing protein [Youngiibacter multivorans]MBP1917987.1 putative membrane protein [Youngiibacter multivorans]
MDTFESRKKSLSTANQKLLTIIASWLLASTLMNWIYRNTPTYFSVKHAGLDGLLPLTLSWLTFTGLFLLIINKASKIADGKDLAGRLLFMSWLLFSSSVMLRLKFTIPAATLLIVNLTSLILARDIFFSAIRTSWLPDKLLSISGIAMVSFNLYVIPWEDTKNRLFSGSEAGTLVPLLLVYIAIILALMIVFNMKSSFLNNDRTVVAVVIIAMLLQIFLSGRILYARYETLSTPTYDFNLFAQMFHSMAEKLQPITTLERNMPLSHFSIHLSPVYYLMLPFYLLFRTPATLNVLQAIIVGSGMIPMVLIARHFRLKSNLQTALSLIYLFSAALMTSGFYDLHENCFLVPFLLWLILSIEKKNSLGMTVFTLLTLSVKEDAALYIWALAAFIIFDRKMVKQGLAMLFASGAYFIGAIRYLNNSGEGAMTGRFEGLIGVPEWSLLSVPYSVIRNPGFILSKVFAEEKLAYIIQMMSPLAFMPLLSRKLTRWILLIPFLLMNLMVDYQYQYDMRFQYNYGSYILLFYMALLFVKDHTDTEQMSGVEKTIRKPTCRNMAISSLLAIAMTSGILISAAHLAQYEHYPRKLEASKASLDSMKNVMDQIPDESSVLATCFLTGYLSGRDTLYDIDYNLVDGTYFRADYIVMDLRPDYKGDHETLLPMFISDGYELMIMNEDEILLLKRSDVP